MEENNIVIFSAELQYVRVTYSCSIAGLRPVVLANTSRNCKCLVVY